MKVAIIIRRLDVKGGSQRLVLYLANKLQEWGHEVKLYAFFYSKESCFPDLLQGLEVVALDPLRARERRYPRLSRIPILGYLATMLRIGRETTSARAMAAMIDRDVDILNPHERVAHRAAHFYQRHVRAVPSVWNTNDTHSLRFLVAKLEDIDPAYGQPWWKHLGYRICDWYENWRYISSQDAIVVVDEFNRRATREYFGREAVVVRNGPNPGQFTYRPRRPLTKEVKLLTSGIFFPHRRFEDAIRGVECLSSWGYDPVLWIIGDPAGDPAYAEKLSQLVRERHLEARVEFLGRISEEKLVSYYHQADIFLYPHHLQSDGLAPTEAMISGLAVIVSRSAGIHEIIRERETGLLVNPKDPEGIAGAVKELIEDPELYLKLSANGSAYVRATLSPETQARGILSVYEEVLRTKRG